MGVLRAGLLTGLRARRLRLHRLEPPRPIRDVRAAAAFVRERRIVLSTGRSSLPMLAEAIAGRPLAGSWMGQPESHRIYRILRRLHTRPDLFAVPLVLGKETFVDAALGAAVQRIAADPQRREVVRDRLPPLARRLLAAVEREGELRMDRWPAPTAAGRQARLRLERELLVVSRGLHTERGYHTAVVMPWARSEIADRYGRAAQRLTLEQAEATLMLAAVRSAVVVPEREARRWFVCGADRWEGLVARGDVLRLAAGRTIWLAINEARTPERLAGPAASGAPGRPPAAGPAGRAR